MNLTKLNIRSYEKEEEIKSWIQRTEKGQCEKLKREKERR